MKKLIALTILGASVAATLPAQARDTKHLLSVQEAMNASQAKDKLDGSVKFFFGTQSHPKVLTKFSSDMSNRKTNAFGKSDTDACNWAFLSTLLAFQDRAHALGANAVINIVSYYKKDEFTSTSEFECHAGALMAGVALKGDFVKISDK